MRPFEVQRTSEGAMRLARGLRMAKFYNELSDDLQQFIGEQHLFFVAPAPENGRINLSPKGMDSFRCVSNNQVMFLNVTGVGNETAAQLDRAFRSGRKGRRSNPAAPTDEKTAVFVFNPQYSSGSSTVITLRSCSIMTQ